MRDQNHIKFVLPSFMNSPGLIPKSKSLIRRRPSFLFILTLMKGTPSQSTIIPSHMGFVPK